MVGLRQDRSAGSALPPSLERGTRAAKEALYGRVFWPRTRRWCWFFQPRSLPALRPLAGGEENDGAPMRSRQDCVSTGLLCVRPYPRAGGGGPVSSHSVSCGPPTRVVRVSGEPVTESSGMPKGTVRLRQFFIPTRKDPFVYNIGACVNAPVGTAATRCESQTGREEVAQLVVI